MKMASPVSDGENSLYIFAPVFIVATKCFKWMDHSFLASSSHALSRAHGFWQPSSFVEEKVEVVIDCIWQGSWSWVSYKGPSNPGHFMALHLLASAFHLLWLLAIYDSMNNINWLCQQKWPLFLSIKTFPLKILFEITEGNIPDVGKFKRDDFSADLSSATQQYQPEGVVYSSSIDKQ